MGKLILASIVWFKRSARPQCHRRGSVETPGGRPKASFGHHIIPYIIYITLKWVNKGLGKLILASIWWFKRFAWPQCHRRGSAETPGGRPTASFGHHVTPYIIYIALIWVYKGLGAWENLFWHSFDDSRGLHDPNATERGLRRPLEVAPQPLLVIISHLYILCIAFKWVYKDLGHGKFCLKWFECMGKLMWHHFDDSMGLHNPKTKERGLRRPLEVTI